MNIIYDNIVYDLQSAGGISTYWYELSKRFLKAEEVNISFLELRSEHSNIQRKLLDIAPVDIKTDSAGGTFIQRFKRIKVIDINPDTIFHSSYYRVPVKKPGIKQVCTIHDFTHDLFFSGPRVWLHNFAKRRAILESDAIITVSENTKRDLLKFYPDIDSSKVFTIYNGVSEEFEFLNSNKKTDTPFFLYVGSRDNYKNFRFAVELASNFKDFKLVIVGNDLTASENKYLEQKLLNRYSLSKSISIAELNMLYNTAFCLLYPSSYEGFGIPLVEAMRAGCPFIALNASSVPEVAGDAGMLLNNLDINEGISAVNTIEKYTDQIREKGFVQSQKFSWDLCYEQTYQLYKEVLK